MYNTITGTLACFAYYFVLLFKQLYLQFFSFTGEALRAFFLTDNKIFCMKLKMHLNVVKLAWIYPDETTLKPIQILKFACI